MRILISDTEPLYENNDESGWPRTTISEARDVLGFCERVFKTISDPTLIPVSLEKIAEIKASIHEYEGRNAN